MEKQISIEELRSKWKKSNKTEVRKSTKDKIKSAYTEGPEVEIIPSRSELTENEPKIIRVAAYCRVSTDEDAQASSYELQVQYYTEYIQHNPEWTFVGIYADEGISGTSVKKRIGFLKMIEDSQKGKIDVIITKSISRFARNILDCITYLRKLRDLEPPVAVYFENENLNTLDRRNEAFIAMLSSVAQGESENKSESIKWAIKRRFQKGIPLCPTSALLGYDTDDIGNMVIVSDEAEIVKYIYGCFLNGLNSREIAQQLTNAQVQTVKGNVVWRSGSIYNILRNEKYCGDVLMQKTVTPDCLTHKSVRNTGQERQYRLRDHHPSIAYFVHVVLRIIFLHYFILACLSF